MMEHRSAHATPTPRGPGGLLVAAARLGRGLTLAALVLSSVALALPPQPAAADDVNLCPSDRPCITELFVSPYSVLTARWTGTWDHYNLRWENPQLVKTDDVQARTAGLTVLESAWNRTYRFSVQGCRGGGFLNPSTCTGWAAREIALQAPAAPTNARLAGDAVVWDRVDPLTFHVELFGTQISDGQRVFVSHVAPPAKSLALASGWRERFRSVETCARNPGGTSCVEVYTRPAPAVPFKPCALCTAPAPTVPYKPCTFCTAP